MSHYLHCLLLACVVVGAILAVKLRDLLFAAIGLGLASVFLAVAFFQMGAGMAGVFELSVGAGLVTVLFIAAISLVDSAREEDGNEE